MKKLLSSIVLLAFAALFFSCEKSGYGNYPGGEVSQYIAIYDVRQLYKKERLQLSKESLSGSTSITGVVTSDHSGNNLPDSLLFIQDKRRLSQLRGIAVNLGTAAKNYTAGDSVVIRIDNASLEKKNGLLQLSGVTAADITKVAENASLLPVIVSANNLVNDPERYESTLLAIVDASFLPQPKRGEVLSGNKNVNDGTGNVTVRTNSDATFAQDTLYNRANYYGIVINSEADEAVVNTYVTPRVADDIKDLQVSSGVQPILITGYMSDVIGPDGNYEYVQLMATQDLDFSVTPFSVVFTNNAGAAQPTGLPKKGWATGGQRTYKFDLKAGAVTKGSFFYVGGSQKKINGVNSTSIASSNWVTAFDYTQRNGDGFGNMTGGILANSGNASGIAVFNDTLVLEVTEPVDVIFIGRGTGPIYDRNEPNFGYRITNNDLFKTLDLISLQPQPFFKSGNNNASFPYNGGDVGYFNQLGGRYNITMQRWTQQRVQTLITLGKEAPITMIEDSLSTKIMRLEGIEEVEDR